MAKSSAATNGDGKPRKFRLARNVPKNTFDLQKIVNQKSEVEIEIFEDNLENLVNFDRTTTQNLLKKELLIGVIPAYTKEDRLNVALQSLIDQTVPLDWILVLLNGPEPKNGELSPAEQQAREFAEKHSNVEVVKLNQAGKVNALNHSYIYINRKIHEFRAQGIDLQIPYALYLDADVRCEKEMVEQLLEEIGDNPQAGGVMARYSFEFQEGRKYSASERSFLYSQRAEFAMKTVKQQVRRRTEILGGQATLFRTEALAKAAEIGYKKMPWSPNTKVEDAELTRVLQTLGYKTLTSTKARAWVDAMLNAHSWVKQREKWQDGHLEDLSLEINIFRDKYRLSEQFALAWNLLIRIIFVAAFSTGIIMNRISLSRQTLMLAALPIFLSILLSFSVAKKIPNASRWEKVRSLLYLPGEIYYLRILAVWLNSMTMLFLGLSRDGWKNQDAAESSNRKTNVLSWMILAIGMMSMSLELFTLSYINTRWFSVAFSGLWIILTIMTIISSVILIRKWFGIFRARHRINP